MDITKFENLDELIIEIRGQRILLDSDVADLYGVETKRINEAVKNNLDKFPEDYMFDLQKEELAFLRSKISTAKLSKTRVMPKAFTEKGLYMLDAMEGIGLGMAMETGRTGEYVGKK